MTIKDLPLDQFKLFVKEAVKEALDEQAGDSETKAWLEATSRDLIKSLRMAEENVPETELATWLEAIENVVKPIDTQTI